MSSLHRIAALTLAGAAVGCGGDAAKRPLAEAHRQPPQVFPNVYTARLEGDASRLWLLLGGRPGEGELALELLSMDRRGRWTVEPKPPDRVTEGLAARADRAPTFSSSAPPAGA